MCVRCIKKVNCCHCLKVSCLWEYERERMCKHWLIWIPYICVCVCVCVCVCPVVCVCVCAQSSVSVWGWLKAACVYSALDVSHSCHWCFNGPVSVQGNFCSSASEEDLHAARTHTHTHTHTHTKAEVGEWVWVFLHELFCCYVESWFTFETFIGNVCGSSVFRLEDLSFSACFKWISK